jgi:hypothetical protein
MYITSWCNGSILPERGGGIGSIPIEGVIKARK